MLAWLYICNVWLLSDFLILYPDYSVTLLCTILKKIRIKLQNDAWIQVHQSIVMFYKIITHQALQNHNYSHLLWKYSMLVWIYIIIL